MRVVKLVHRNSVCSIMQPRQRSLLLVSSQMILLLLLLATTPWRKMPLLSYLLLGLSFALIAWAIGTMRKSKLRVSPMPDAKATLVTDGPYKFIRHPMYTSILLGSAGLLVHHFTWMRLGVAVTLAIVLIFKLGWEEEMLRAKFPDYGDYMKRSKRILPFVV